MTSDVGEVGYKMEPTGDRYAHSITTPSTIQLYSPKEIAHAVARQLQRRASVPKVEELGRAANNIYVIKNSQTHLRILQVRSTAKTVQSTG